MFRNRLGDDITPVELIFLVNWNDVCHHLVYDEDHGMLEVDNSDNISGITDSSINISATRFTPRFTRSSSEHIKSFTKLCFVCQEVRLCEENRYNHGGIGRCEQSSFAIRIK